MPSTTARINMMVTRIGAITISEITLAADVTRRWRLVSPRDQLSTNLLNRPMTRLIDSETVNGEKNTTKDTKKNDFAINARNILSG